MYNLRKKVVVLISILMVVNLLFSCNQQAPSTSEEDQSLTSVQQEHSTQSTPEIDSSQYKEIDWFLSASPVPSPWNLDMPVLSEISKRTGVIMNANMPAQDADTKLNLLMVNGQLPDVISITNQTLYSELIASGEVWEINEFFQTYLPDAAIINGQFPEDIKNAVTTRDGGWYSIPSHLSSEDNEEIWGFNPATKEYWDGWKTANQFTLVINRPIMEELGITVEDIKTEEDLLDALVQVKESNITNADGGSVYPLMIHGDSFANETSRAINNLFGAMPVDKEGNYQSQYYSDQYRDGIEFLNKAYRLGVLDPNVMTIDELAMVALMNEDRVFCHIGGTAAHAIMDRLEKDDTGNATGRLVWISPGVIDWESGYTPAIGVNSAVNQGWIQTFISKNAAEPEAIARFIDYMMFSEEGNILWNYGIEGDDWFYNDDMLIERTTKGQEDYDNMATTGVGAFWLFCNVEFDRSVLNVTRSIEDVVDAALGLDSRTYIYDEIALQMPSGYIESGSKYDITNIEVENYVPQQLAKIILADTDEQFNSLYEEFITQLDKLGLRDLDDHKNEVVQQNYEVYGYRLEAIN